MHEGARSVADRSDHMARHQDAAHRLIAAAQSLRDHLDIRRDRFLFPGMHGAGAAHAAHHLIQDQQRAVTRADLPHRPEIAGQRRDAAERCTHHRFRDEGRDGLGAERLELGLQFGREARDVIVVGLVIAPVAIGVAGRDMPKSVRQHRHVELAPHRIAAGGQRAERVAMVALPPRDEARALWLAAFHVILPRHLQRGLRRLRARRTEIHMREPARLVPQHQIGQLFRRFAGIERGVGVADLRRLRAHRLQHARMAVAEAGDGRAAGSVDDGLSVGITNENALARQRERRGLAQVALDEAGHGGMEPLPQGGVNSPTTAPVMQQAMVPLTRAGRPRRTISARRSGHIATMPPSMIPTEPRLAKPHSA